MEDTFLSLPLAMWRLIIDSLPIHCQLYVRSICSFFRRLIKRIRDRNQYQGYIASINLPLYSPQMLIIQALANDSKKSNYENTLALIKMFPKAFDSHQSAEIRAIADGQLLESNTYFVDSCQKDVIAAVMGCVSDNSSEYYVRSLIIKYLAWFDPPLDLTVGIMTTAANPRMNLWDITQCFFFLIATHHDKFEPLLRFIRRGRKYDERIICHLPTYPITRPRYMNIFLRMKSTNVGKILNTLYINNNMNDAEEHIALLERSLEFCETNPHWHKIIYLQHIGSNKYRIIDAGMGEEVKPGPKLLSFLKKHINIINS